MQSPVRVAVLDGLGISSVCVSVTEKSFDEDDNVVYERLTPSDVNTEGVLDKFDVFVCPGGSFQGVHHALGPIGRERLRTFIEKGGGFVGVCGGAYFGHAMGLAKIHVSGTNFDTKLLSHYVANAYLTPLDGFTETLNYGREWSDELDYVSLQGGPMMGPSAPHEIFDDRCGEVHPIALFANDILADYRTDVEMLEARYSQQNANWACLHCEQQNLDSSDTCIACGLEKPLFRTASHRAVYFRVPEDSKPPVGLMPGTWAATRSTFGQGKVVLISPHPELTGGKEYMQVSAVLWARPSEGAPILHRAEPPTDAAELLHRTESCISEPADDSMFGVVVDVKAGCEHLAAGVNPEALKFSNIFFAACEHGECNHREQNMVCLQCGHIACGRGAHRHAKQHHEETQHPVVCGLADLSFWCYACEAADDLNCYVDGCGEHVVRVYNTLHVMKFGELIPGRHGKAELLL